MIPQIIHYIWLGGAPLPKIAEKCIESWKKYCPDYEIKRWDESNLNINCCKYCKEAYDAKKFAFASDVLRFDVLNKEGGIYLDIDVELIKSLDDLLDNKIVSGFENEQYIAPGLILAAEKGNKLIKEVLESYKDRTFVVTLGMKKQETICSIFSNKLKELGFKMNNTTQEINGIKIYSSEYFCPKSMSDGKIRLTSNTFSIHHYASTWVPKRIIIKLKIIQFIKRVIGEKNIKSIKRFIKQKKNN